MADRDQQKQQQGMRPDRDELTVEDLEVPDEKAGEVKGGTPSLSYGSVKQDYTPQKNL